MLSKGTQSYQITAHLNFLDTSLIDKKNGIFSNHGIIRISGGPEDPLPYDCQ